LPLFEFNGFQPTFYSGLRDANGQQLGYIQPGEIVDIPEAPDSCFIPLDAPPEIPDPGAGESADPVGIPSPPEPEPAPDPQPSPAAPVQINPATAAVVH
jgi:hypothetical protein